MLKSQDTFLYLYIFSTPLGEKDKVWESEKKGVKQSLNLENWLFFLFLVFFFIYIIISCMSKLHF